MQLIFKKSVISDTHHGITHMYINFQHNRVSRSVKSQNRIHTNLFAKSRKLHKFASTNSNVENINYFRYTSSYNVDVYQLSAKSGYRSIDQSKLYTQIYLQINCINLQLPIVILKQSIISDIHHRITYMNINVQQNHVSRSVKTVRTNIFAKNWKLHKFATIPIIFF